MSPLGVQTGTATALALKRQRAHHERIDETTKFRLRQRLRAALGDLTLVAHITPFADHVTQTPRKRGMLRRSSATATAMRAFIVYVVTRDPLRRGHDVRRSNRDLLRFATVCYDLQIDDG